jgi:hypothetical protein
MYGYVEQSHKIPTVKDVICPECFRHLTAPTVMPQERHASGNTIRSYFGWCFNCNKGFAAMQFYNAQLGRWVLCQYQHYTLVGGVPILNNQFHVVCPMPDIPVIKTGTGGDYTQGLTPSDVAGAVHQTKEVMAKVVHILQELKSTLNQIVK